MFSGVRDVDSCISQLLDAKTAQKIAISSKQTSTFLHNHPINLERFAIELLLANPQKDSSNIPVRVYFNICKTNRSINALKNKNLAEMSIWELIICRFLSQHSDIPMPNPTSKEFVITLIKSDLLSSNWVVWAINKLFSSLCNSRNSRPVFWYKDTDWDKILYICSAYEYPSEEPGPTINNSVIIQKIKKFELDNEVKIKLLERMTAIEGMQNSQLDEMRKKQKADININLYFDNVTSWCFKIKISNQLCIGIGIDSNALYLELSGNNNFYIVPRGENNFYLEACRKNNFIRALRYKKIKDMNIWELMICSFLSSHDFKKIPKPTAEVCVLAMIKSNLLDMVPNWKIIQLLSDPDIPDSNSDPDSTLDIWSQIFLVLTGKIKDSNRIETQILPKIKALRFADRDIQIKLLHYIEIILLMFKCDVPNKKNIDLLMKKLSQPIDVFMDIESPMVAIKNRQIKRLSTGRHLYWKFSNCKFINTNMRNIIFYKVTLKSCTFNNMSIDYSDMDDTIIDKCHFLNANLKNLFLKDSSIYGTVFNNVNFADTRLPELKNIRSCVFVNCDMSSATFLSGWSGMMAAYQEAPTMYPMIMFGNNLSDKIKQQISHHSIFTLAELTKAVKDNRFTISRLVMKDLDRNRIKKTYFNLMQKAFCTFIQAELKHDMKRLSKLHNKLMKCVNSKEIINELKTWKKELSQGFGLFKGNPNLKINFDEMIMCAMEIHEHAKKEQSLSTHIHQKLK